MNNDADKYLIITESFNRLGGFDISRSQRISNESRRIFPVLLRYAARKCCRNDSSILMVTFIVSFEGGFIHFHEFKL